MNEIWVDRWNERYGNEAFAYGTEPNEFLRHQLKKLNPGKILFPAEGEGRNAVFAAQSGWEVSAFDISIEGKKKATQLSEKVGVKIDYHVGELESLNFNLSEFDALALIYAHFPADIKSKYHQILDKYVKKGGFVIFEAFSKKHIDYVTKDERIGGPKDLGMLFSIEEIKTDFQNYEIIELTEMEVELKEGLYHNGIGSVIRFVGRKFY